MPQTDPWAEFEPAQPAAQPAADSFAGFEQDPAFAAPPVAPQPMVAQAAPKTKTQSAWASMRKINPKQAVATAGELVVGGLANAAGMAAGGITGINEASGYVPDEPGGRSFEPPQGSRLDRAVAGVEEGQKFGQALAEAVMGPLNPETITVLETIDPYLAWGEQMISDIAYEAGDPTDVAGATMAKTAMEGALLALPSLFFRTGKAGKAGKGKTDGTLYDSVTQRANDLYAKADAVNAGVKAESFQRAMGTIEKHLMEKGYDPGLHPRTAAALRNLTEKSGNHQTMQGVEINRRIINEARGTMEKADAKMASEMLDVYDDWMSTLSQKDFLVGNGTESVKLYKEARDLWTRKIKADEIQWAIERAKNKQNNYTQSGFNNALRREFQAIINNPKRLRRYTKDEQALLKMVANGDAGQRLASAVGRFAVRGPVSAGMSAVMGTSLGATFGPLGYVAPMLLGEAGRRIATSLRTKRANQALNTVLEDKP